VGVKPRRSEHDLGRIVRTLRRRQKLSLRELAAAIDFSPSFISQVENNLASPSVSSLERLAHGLGVSLPEFFEVEAPLSPITHAARRRTLRSHWSRARLEVLGPVGAGRKLETVLVRISPGGTSGKREHPAHGERFAFVVDGRITLTVEGATHSLRRGDAITINAGAPHRWENTSRARTVLLLVTTRRA
jgi:quercetin dioxygenase-like cupin family protein